MNQSSNIFVEFSAKIRRVLECPDPDVVLRALRDLAEGRAASISGIEVDSLSGLGQQIFGNVSNSDYREAMTTLLEWGMRSFLTQPSHNANANHLWTSMAKLDGEKGYAQRLLPSGPFFEGGVRIVEVLEDGQLNLSPPPTPRIITKADQQPEAGARAVVATSSSFGWENLYVQCICLYVDADTTQSLAASAATQSVRTIILEGELRHATASMEAATKLLEPQGLDRLAISERKCVLRENPGKLVRCVRRIRPFMHGQSISPMNTETKGSVAVFLSPEDEAENRTYALTAYHVVPSSAEEKRVITPGGLDILTRLLEIHSSPEDHEELHKELDFLLERWNNKCGEVQYGHIGVNGNGWRSDWALVCLENEWKGVNGSWMRNEMNNLCIAKHSAPETFTGSSGIITCDDAMSGTICYKDGASTGCNAGRVGPTQAKLYKKGTAEAITGEESQEQVDYARLVTVHPIGGVRDVVLPGDSGCGGSVLSQRRMAGIGLGQFVSIFYPKDGGVCRPYGAPKRNPSLAAGSYWQILASIS